MFQEIGSESPEGGLNPKTLLDTPIPGEFYPRRNLKQMVEGIKSLDLKIKIFLDKDGETQVLDEKTGKIYWLDVNGRIKVDHSSIRHISYIYDEHGKLCGKRVEERMYDTWNITEHNRFTYDSPTSKKFSVAPLVFNDGIAY